jgi:hypothetical protein
MKLMENVHSFLNNYGYLTTLFQDQGLATAWDDHLSYILTPALSAYETERLTGEAFSLQIMRSQLSH